MSILPSTFIDQRISDRDLLSMFESVGLNCEFGLVQRAVGIERLGLLKWCVSEPSMLIAALRDKFEGLGDAGNVEIGVHGWEYDVIDKKFGFRGHSFVNKEEISADKFLVQMQKRLKYLKNKFLEDLYDGGYIYVFKQNGKPFPFSQIDELAWLINSYGGARLLWISEAAVADQEAGFVEFCAPYLIRGYVSHLAPYDDAHDIDVGGWVEVCRRAYSLVQGKGMEPVQKNLLHPDGWKSAVDSVSVPAYVPALEGNDEKIAVCIIAKNEERYVSEWIAYYISIGVDSIIFFDNNSSDDTVKIARKFEKIFDIRIIDWPSCEITYQIDAYNEAISRFATEFDWIGFFDSDEFFVDCRGRNIHDVISEYKEFSGLAANWKIFGSSYLEFMKENSVIRSMLLRSEDSFDLNRHVKVFVRPRAVRRCVSPHFFDLDGDFVDGNKRVVDWDTPGITRSVISDTDIRINHYYVRSKAGWRQKIQRGYPDVDSNRLVALEKSLDYVDRNDIFDRLILAFDDFVDRNLRLVGMSRPEIFNVSSNETRIITNVETESSVSEQDMPVSMRDSVVRSVWRGRDPFIGFPRNVFAHDLQGWGDQHPYIRETVIQKRPRVVVEVGVWKGATTIAMAKCLKEIGQDGVVIAVDTWLGAWDHWINDEWFEHLGFSGGSPMIMKKFMNNVCVENVEDVVLPLPLDSLNAAYVLKHFGVFADVIHIDGGHDYEAVMADLLAWWPVLSEGGVLVGDDYYPETGWPDVKRAFDEFFHNKGYAELENFGGKCRVEKRRS